VEDSKSVCRRLWVWIGVQVFLYVLHFDFCQLKWGGLTIALKLAAVAHGAASRLSVALFASSDLKQALNASRPDPGASLGLVGDMYVGWTG